MQSSTLNKQSAVTLPPLNEFCQQIYQANKAKGFWPDDRNIPEVFMLIISEVAEALEARRTGKESYITDYFSLNEEFSAADDSQFSDLFVAYVKDATSDELADAVIRIFDLIGYANPNPDFFVRLSENINQADDTMLPGSIGQALLKITSCVVKASECRPLDSLVSAYHLGTAVGSIYQLAKYNGIDLDWHIVNKLRYNTTRAFKHGKSF